MVYTRLLRVVLSLTLLASVCLFVEAAAARGRSGRRAGGQISWSTNQLSQAVAPGQQASLAVSFSSSAVLSDTTLRVVGPLAKIMTTDPTSIASVAANTPITVTLNVAVPADWKGNADGGVVVLVGNRQAGRPLRVRILTSTQATTPVSTTTPITTTTPVSSTATAEPGEPPHRGEPGHGQHPGRPDDGGRPDQTATSVPSYPQP